MDDINSVTKDIFNVIKVLPERPRDILLLRFGLYGGPALTLNHIGRKYSITRERVRQVQNNSLQQLRNREEMKILKPYIDQLEDILNSHGKIMAEKHIVPVARKLFGLSKNDKLKGAEIIFLLNLGKNFRESKRSQEFNTFWYLNQGDEQKAKSVVGNFVKEVKRKEEALPREKLYSMLSSMVKKELGLDLSTGELRAILNLSRELKKNCLNLWGYKNWPEITPKNSGDYAYLAMLSTKKPLHFSEIPKVVNEEGINTRKLHAPTVHNVLIKDPRFVLIGKGRYALSKWGYVDGTVSDLIKHFLKKEGGKMKKDELVTKILDQKEVKKSTVLLNINRSSEVEDEEGLVKLISV